MPATPSRIGFILQEFRNVTAGPDATVDALYGNKARDTKEAVRSFFESQSDALVMAEERLALLSPTRSFVTANIDGIDDLLALDFTERVPTVRVIDDEQDRNSLALAVGITIDMGRRRATVETWG